MNWLRYLLIGLIVVAALALAGYGLALLLFHFLDGVQLG